MNNMKPLLKKPGEWMRTLSPNCREVARLQSRALDERLPFGTRCGMRLHLFLCRWCRRYRNQIRFLHEALHGDCCRLEECHPARLPAEARERIVTAMRASR